MLPVWLPLLVPLPVAFFASLLLIKTAPLTGLLDHPDGGRKSHPLPTPTGGGIAVAVAFFCGIAFLPMSLPRGFIFPVLGGLLLLVMGVVDDRFGLPALRKLLIQIVAAGFSLIPLLSLLNPAHSFPRNIALLSIMGFFLLTLTNGYNLIDGLDGLSASLSVLSASLLIIFGSLAPYTPPPQIPLLSALLSTSLLGFLFFNLPPARLFLGDSGSHFAGFFIAWLWLQVAATSHLGAIAAVSANLIPVADVVGSAWRRARSGVSIFRPDRQHIHFRALKRFQSPSLVTLVFLLGTILSFSFFTLLKVYIGE